MRILRRDQWGRRGDILPVQDSLREDTKANLPVEIIDHKGRKLPGKVAGFDQETGLGLVRLLVPAQGEPFVLGDAQALKEKDAVLAAGARGNIAPAFITSRREFTGGWEYLLDNAIFTFPPIADWGGAALIEPVSA